MAKNAYFDTMHPLNEQGGAFLFGLKAIVSD